MRRGDLLTYSSLIPAKMVRPIAWSLSNPSNIAFLDQLLANTVERFEGIIAQHPETRHWTRDQVYHEALQASSAVLDVALVYARQRRVA